MRTARSGMSSKLPIVVPTRERHPTATAFTARGGKVEYVISAPSIQFKGAGWYVTDYGGKKAGADGDKADKPATETKETASKEKDSASKEGASKESSSGEGKDKKPAKKK